tara:strand:- start:181 stop:387 length:207 start_codon:yes stop_codon:yes gene_type:complete
MQIRYSENTEKYTIESEGNIIIEADSVQELYDIALDILSAFSKPTAVKAISNHDHQRALDLLTGQFKG